jgi:hypothetical protein
MRSWLYVSEESGKRRCASPRSAALPCIREPNYRHLGNADSLGAQNFCSENYELGSLVFRPALRYGGSFRKGGKARENAQKLPRGNVLIGLRQFAHFSIDLSSNRFCWSIKIKIAASIDFVEDVSQSRSCATMKKWLCQVLAFLHSVFRILYFMIFKMNFLSGYFYK